MKISRKSESCAEAAYVLEPRRVHEHGRIINGQGAKTIVNEHDAAGLTAQVIELFEVRQGTEGR